MYLLIIEDDNFGFTILEEKRELLDNEFEISKEEYSRFFQLQSDGKQFRVKSEIDQAKDLFDYIEEREVDESDANISPIQILEDENKKLKLALAEMAEKQEVDKLEIQIAYAELVESLTASLTAR